MRAIAACFAMCGCIIVVAVIAVWSVSSASYEVIAPARIIDARFPDELEYLKPVDRARTIAATKVVESFDVLLSGGGPMLPMMQASEYMRAYNLERDQSATLRVATSGSSAVPIPAPVIAEPRARQPRRAIFNDAQIASIKARLALDRDQEQHWPAVEAALRSIAWRGGGSSAAQLDPSSVQRLAIASASLIDKLRENQKRELKVFARLMGLEKLASEL
jgi:hypothetical protein